jgi:hypothetical protein
VRARAQFPPARQAKMSENCRRRAYIFYLRYLYLFVSLLLLVFRGFFFYFILSRLPRGT